MEESPASVKVLACSALFSLLILALCAAKVIPGSGTKIVFCDVGQGDGAYVRIRNKIDIIIDAGPDNSQMLRCLGKHMPFWDRTLEYAIISHPQSDHMGGLSRIMDRYRVLSIYSLPLPGGFPVPEHIPLKGEALLLPGARITFLNPPKSRLRLPVKDPNSLSVITELEVGNTRVFFTGDASSGVLDSLEIGPAPGATVVKIAHHGSRNAISVKFLRLAHPTLTVISVGKNNPFGHPSKELTDLLKALKIPTKRTDAKGDIVVAVP